ncbi:MAG: hypothetical protein KAG94_02910 [Clostridiales bacterium]|nr:hypothetical protein [Clostridiales bacterium]
MNRKKALELLNLSEEASNNQICKKYDNILRQAKFDKTIDTKSVCEAYDFLISNYKTENKSVTKMKFENFCYYHLKTVKFITGIVIFISLCIIFISLYIKSNPKPDLTIVFVGERLIYKNK